LNNPGTIRTDSFVNQGGTLNGNPPVLLGAGPNLRIAHLSVSARHLSAEAGPSAQLRLQTLAVSLECRGLPRQHFDVETSSDLVNWAAVPSTCSEISPGVFHVEMTITSANLNFLRLHLRQKQPAPF
jgi:hypothetical protein